VTSTIGRRIFEIEGTMRLTFQMFVDAIAEIGPATSKQLAKHLGMDWRKVRGSLSQWTQQGKAQHDDSKPASKYSPRPLNEIGRDEMGRLSEPKIGDPSPEEIKLRTAEIRAEWDAQTEYSRRVQKPQGCELIQTGTSDDSFGGMDFS
jgi:hypothetical protein